MPVTDPYMKLAAFGAFVISYAAKEGAVDLCTMRDILKSIGLDEATPDLKAAITDLMEQTYD